MAKLPATKELFLERCAKLSAGRIALNYEKFDALADEIPAGRPFHWPGYVSPELYDGSINLPRLTKEFALISAHQGGFIDAAADGSPRKWEIDGSGSKAMLALFDRLREAKALPGVNCNQPRDVDVLTAPMLEGVPFARQRIAMFKEFSGPKADGIFEHLAKRRVMTPDGDISIGYQFVQDLHQAFPLSFGTDPLGKKACLAGLLLASHLKSRGKEVAIDIPAALDYRLPQVLDAKGAFTYLTNPEEGFFGTRLLESRNAMVAALRGATGLAADRLSRCSGQAIDAVDGYLWKESRKVTAPHIMVKTCDF